jgi:hypothetical protein
MSIILHVDSVCSVDIADSVVYMCVMVQSSIRSHSQVQQSVTYSGQKVHTLLEMNTSIYIRQLIWELVLGGRSGYNFEFMLRS